MESTMPKRSTMTLLITTLALLIPATMASAQVVRLHGATTVLDRVIYPHQNAVERATGLRLELVGNATGKGLVDLVEGRADASLCSEPLEVALVAAASAGKQVDRSRIQFHVVDYDGVAFAVHRSNPVTSLTWEQLRDIHTGKIKNWKDVGGDDSPITVYADTPTGGTRAMVKEIVMGGEDYLSSIVSLTAVKKVADMTAVDPTGIGAVGQGFLTSQNKRIETRELERPLGFITIGAPSPEVQKVIDAFKAEVAKATE